MPRNTKRKYRQVVDYIEDEVGVDIPRDVKKMAIQEVDVGPSSNSIPTEPNTSDSDSINGATLPADSEVVMNLSLVGTESLIVQAKSTGSYNLVVRWKDNTNTVIREETVSSSVSGGSWTDFNIDSKSDSADVVVVDNSSSEQTVNATAHSG